MATRWIVTTHAGAYLNTLTPDESLLAVFNRGASVLRVYEVRVVNSPTTVSSTMGYLTFQRIAELNGGINLPFVRDAGDEDLPTGMEAAAKARTLPSDVFTRVIFIAGQPSPLDSRSWRALIPDGVIFAVSQDTASAVEPIVCRQGQGAEIAAATVGSPSQLCEMLVTTAAS